MMNELTELTEIFDSSQIPAADFPALPKQLSLCVCGSHLIKFTQHTAVNLKYVALRCVACNYLTGITVPKNQEGSVDLTCECGCPEVVILPQLLSPIHQAALRCHQCDRFLKWLPKPKIETNHEKIQGILSNYRHLLTTWERGFLEYLMGFVEFSDDQLARLETIYQKLGVSPDKFK